MTEFSAVSLKIETVGDREAFAALDALDRKGRQVVDNAAGAMGRAMGDVAVAYQTGGAKMQRALADVADAHRANLKELALEEAATNRFSGSATTGFGRIRQGLTSLLAQLTGTTPVLDRVAGQFLAMGEGGTVTIAAVAGLAAIAYAWNRITEDARAAEKAQDAALQKLIEWDKQKHLDAGGQFGEQVSGASASLGRQVDKRYALAGLAAQGGPLGAFADAIGFLAIGTRKQFDEAVTAVRDGRAALGEEITRAFVDQRSKTAQTLAENIKSNNATHAERLRAAEMLKQDRALMQQYVAGGVAGDIRSALGSEIAGLDGALNPEDKDGERAARAAESLAKRQAKAYQVELTKDLKAATKVAVAAMVDAAETTYGAQQSVVQEFTPDKKALADSIKESVQMALQIVANDPLLTHNKQIKDLAKQLSDQLTVALKTGLINAFETAFSGGGFASGFKALAASVLGAFGSFLEQLGASMLITGTFMEAFVTAMHNLNGPVMVAAGVGLIAAGAALKAVAGSFGGGGSTGGSYGGSYAGGSGAAQIVDRGIISPDAFSSTNAGTIKPRPQVTVNATIFGTNDAVAQRGFDEMLRKSAQRGSLVPA